MAQPLEKLVAYFATGDRHALGVFEAHPFDFIIKRAGGVFSQRQDFRVRDTQFATHGSVDVLSELTTVDRGHPPVDEAL